MRNERSSGKPLNLPVLGAQKILDILEKETAMIQDFDIIQIDGLCKSY